MASGLLAGFAKPQQFEDLCQKIDFQPQNQPCEGQVAFLTCDEPNSWIGHFDEILVLVRGYATLPGSDSVATPKDFARHVYQRYESEQSCSLSDCEGNFSVVIVDAQKATLLAYRNIASNRYTYVHQSSDLVLVSSNLAMVSHLADLKPNHRSLPALFMFRTCPGAETLFQDIKRLLPGQSLRFVGDECKITQEQTFADLASPQTVSSDEAIRQWDGLFDTVHRNIAQIDPAAVTMLSGGVDSCMVHAHWMNESRIPATQIASMSIATEAEETQADTQYALSLSLIHISEPTRQEASRMPSSA